MKLQSNYPDCKVKNQIIISKREDDSNWPKKNIVGKQELEIRVGSDHISFEVRPFVSTLMTYSYIHFRLPKLARSLIFRTAKIRKVFAFSIT